MLTWQDCTLLVVGHLTLTLYVKWPTHLMESKRTAGSQLYLIAPRVVMDSAFPLFQIQPELDLAGFRN